MGEDNSSEKKSYFYFSVKKYIPNVHSKTLCVYEIKKVL